MGRSLVFSTNIPLRFSHLPRSVSSFHHLKKCVSQRFSENCQCAMVNGGIRFKAAPTRRNLSAKNLPTKAVLSELPNQRQYPKVAANSAGPIPPSQLIQVVETAAKTGAEVVMEAVNKPRNISYKGLTDLVTDTDKMSEAAILEVVRKNFADHLILGEEGGVIGDTLSDYLWCIDPLGMAGGDASKESHKRKREVSRKVRAMKGAATADAQTLHCESIEVPSSPTRPQEQPIPEIEVIAPAPQQIELPPPPPPPPPPSSSNIEGESSGPTVRTLSRGAQLLIQSLERNRSTRGNPDIAKVMGASICFQEDRNRLAEESLDDILAQTMSLGLEAITNQHILREKPHGLKKEILKAVQDASVAQAQLSSANEYIARMEDQMKRYEERIVEAERELEDSRAGWSADLARYAEDLQAKEEELRAKDEELQAKEEESTTKEAEAYVNAHNDLMAELKKRHPEEDFSWMNELAP